MRMPRKWKQVSGKNMPSQFCQNYLKAITVPPLSDAESQTLGTVPVIVGVSLQPVSRIRRRVELDNFLSYPWGFWLLVFMFFRQVKCLDDNFSYIVADDNSREAAVIDSSYNANEIAEILKSKDFKLEYIINTHGHSDHTAGNAELRAEFDGRIVAHESSKTKPDVTVTDGEVIVVGTIRMKVIHTPGHTPDSICLLVDDKLLTGDTLFVGEEHVWQPFQQTDEAQGRCEGLSRTWLWSEALFDDRGGKKV
jgi:hypothetical protein